MERKIITGLSSSEYEHPFDGKTLEALKATPGLPMVVKTLRKYSFDKIQKVTFTGSYLKLGPRQLPHIYDLFIEACGILGFTDPPKLYVQQMYEINAFATCFAEPIIVLGTGALEVLSDEELMFIIGHELGHVKSQHLLYKDIATQIGYLGSIIGDLTLGLGGVVAKGLEIALYYWSRMSELTCDRAGLLVCQDVEKAMTTTAKMSGVSRKYLGEINLDEFMQQARDFEGYDADTFDKIAKVFSVMYMTHPWTVMRAAELDKWVQSGQYNRVLNREEKKAAQPALPALAACTACGAALRPENKFCPNCGAAAL